jgi:hypothetical protein
MLAQMAALALRQVFRELLLITLAAVVVVLMTQVLLAAMVAMEAAVTALEH